MAIPSWRGLLLRRPARWVYRKVHFPSEIVFESSLHNGSGLAAAGDGKHEKWITEAIRH